jgi:hypothetical protein
VTTKPLKKGATYDDLVRIPEHFVAERFDGELYASPQPAVPHARAASVLGVEQLTGQALTAVTAMSPPFLTE